MRRRTQVTTGNRASAQAAPDPSWKGVRSSLRCSPISYSGFRSGPVRPEQSLREDGWKDFNPQAESLGDEAAQRTHLGLFPPRRARSGCQETRGNRSTKPWNFPNGLDGKRTFEARKGNKMKMSSLSLLTLTGSRAFFKPETTQKSECKHVFL